METVNDELVRLREMERSYRASLIQRFRDREWDLDDLQSALDEAGLRPYGANEHVVVTITFKIGLEDERPPRPLDLENYVEAIREAAADDSDWMILHSGDEIDIDISPIRRGNLPS